MSTEMPSRQSDKTYLIETSWEVCNKIGGIYTVLSTKARVLQEEYGDRLLFIGPYFGDNNDNPLFISNSKLLNGFEKKAKLPFGITVKTGRWNIPGSPQVCLIGFEGVYDQLNDIFSLMWNEYGVNSLHEYGDYREGCAFSVATALVIVELSSHLKINSNNIISHFNEWTTGMGLLYLQKISPEIATIFTTHATSIGRSICGNGKPLYDYFEGYNGDQMAIELNMEAKHSLEKTTALNADCFTAVSDITAKECEQLLQKKPDVVTPNGFEPDFVPNDTKYLKLRKEGRKKILDIISKLKKINFDSDSLIIATSGRNEFRNKGIDIFLDSLAELEKIESEKNIIALVLVPAWVNEPIKSLLTDNLNKEEVSYQDDFLTHSLHNTFEDQIACKIRNLESENKIGENVHVLYVPCYLNGGDGIFNISYYDLLPAIDITFFGSYYEPWGYTPLESIAFGIPTITSDKSGFGQWILSEFVNSLYACGVKVIGRSDSNYLEFTEESARQIKEYSKSSDAIRKNVKEKCMETSKQADWKFFIEKYLEAFKIAKSHRDQRINF